MRGVVLQIAAEAVVIQMHRLIIDCYDCSADCSVKNCNSMSGYIIQGLLADASCTIRGVRMTATPGREALVRPRVIVDYSTGDPAVILQNVDDLLQKLGIEGAKAIIAEVVSHAVEGAVVGGAAGAATGAGTKNGAAALGAALLGALAGAVVGTLLEETIPKFEARKEQGTWEINPIRPV